VDDGGPVEGVRDRIAPVLRHYSVVHVAAFFGSFVGGEIERSSDVDILVEFGEGL